MKIRTLLSILLIGMISLTSFATTSKMERKQKPTITLNQKVFIDVVNVEKANDINVVQSNPRSETITLFYLKNANYSFNTLKPADDVGWYCKSLNFITYSKSKLPEVNRITIVPIKLDGVIRIRNDS